jgi:hypothetical protein
LNASTSPASRSCTRAAAVKWAPADSPVASHSALKMERALATRQRRPPRSRQWRRGRGAPKQVGGSR